VELIIGYIQMVSYSSRYRRIDLRPNLRTLTSINLFTHQGCYQLKIASTVGNVFSYQSLLYFCLSTV